jgi:ACT domain-containing protein
MTATSPRSNRVIVTVIGKDQVGIIAAVSTILADTRANILDISQSIMDEFFVMIMMVDLAGASVPFEEVKRRLAEKGTSMGLRIDAQHEDVFKYMHRI